MLTVTLAGLHQEHPGLRVIDFPRGYGHWAFMLFYTPYRVRTDGGMVDGVSGDIMINSPDYPMRHQGIAGVFRNDWFHCTGDGLKRRLDELHIPVNVPITIPVTPAHASAPADYFRSIKNEWALKPPRWEEGCRGLIDLLLIEVHRLRREAVSGAGHLERLEELRRLFRENPGRPWSIDELAKLVNLSPSRFSHLFKEYFHVSPWEDLLQTRLDLAKKLLIRTNLMSRAIAERCGFNDERYFSRCFRRREGLPPGEFRRRGSLPNAVPPGYKGRG